ncbi:hypothetical protein ACTL32_18335 [Planococcus sp. FY231025]|uniref:hypothetical protein n=1 Tax=Planococcus sp. FY231025 TaxID=3455699 RepID=UPI003F916016
MNTQIKKYKTLLKTVDNTLNALNGERVSILHIGSLKVQRQRFAGDPVGVQLVDRLLEHVELYHKESDIRMLRASGKKVNAAMDAILIAGLRSQGADR